MNKKIYININTELNIYQIIEYCYNRLAILDKTKQAIFDFSRNQTTIGHHCFTDCAK